MDHRGRLSLEHRPLTIEPEPPPLCVALAAEGVDSRDIFLFHKTTHRQVYESALAARPGFDEVILFNEEGQLTEFTVGNLVADLDGRLVTPPVSCGLLPGTFREDLLERGLVTERIICREDLSRCTRLFMVNSVRRWQPAQLI
jgi:para-aminobenzoate synthetase/4-amino-4-deoxychorismate lyase